MVGIAAKVIIEQYYMDGSTVDVEEQIKVFGRTLHQLTASVETVSESVKAQNDYLVKQHAEHSALLIKDIEAFKASMKKHHVDFKEELKSEHEGYIKSLVSNSTSLIKEFDDKVKPLIVSATNGLASFSSKLQLATGNLDGVTNGLEKAKSGLDKSHQATLDVKNDLKSGHKELINQVNENLTGVTSSVGDLKNNINDLSRAVGALSELQKFDELGSHITELGEKINELNTIAGEDIFSPLKNSLKGVSRTAEENIKHLNDVVEQSSKQLVSRVTEAQELNIKLAESVNKSSEIIVNGLKNVVTENESES
ncbi:hypothetical protein GCM10025772_12170 [Ferrimonas gelatinilytica]|uniref:Uncharacterized protein n=2 Tax=Ferrimonas gelatinilytica TaxID=1255257 RepID=A0ABP9S1N1_9GAMM